MRFFLASARPSIVLAENEQGYIGAGREYPSSVLLPLTVEDTIDCMRGARLLYPIFLPRPYCDMAIHTVVMVLAKQ